MSKDNKPTNKTEQSKIQINWAEVEDEVENLSTGNNKIWKQQDLGAGESETIRLQCPQTGKFFLKVIILWINNKPFISRRTFGLPCAMMDEYDLAKMSKDADVKYLIAGKENKNFSKQERMIFTGLRLAVDYNSKTKEIEDVRVKGNKGFLLQFNPPLAAKLLNFAQMIENLSGTESLSIMHRTKGKNIKITKDGSGLSTSYEAVLLDRMDLSEEDFDQYYENVLDPRESLVEDLKDEDYSVAVLRNYLYGEDIPEDFMEMYEAEYEEQKEEKSSKAKSRFGKGGGGNSNKSQSGKKSFSKSVEDDLDDE